jgi:hypothetical protein
MVWIIAAIVVLSLVAFFLGHQSRGQNPQLVAIISIKEDGTHNVIFEPDAAMGADLTRLLLVYASKLRWLVLSEDHSVQNLFQGLTREIADVWLLAEDSLLEVMPTANALRDAGGLFSVPGGETFTVKYYRTQSSSPNRSFLHNDLPRPGLAANLPWHFCVLSDAVFQRLGQQERDTAYAAYATWLEAAYEGFPPSNSLQYLTHLVRAADVAYEGAAAGSIV